MNHRRWLPSLPLALAVALLGAGCADDPAPTRAGSDGPPSSGPTLTPAPEPQAESPVARRASSPREVADQVVGAERAIRDPDTPSEELAAAGHAQQLAYRVLGTRPGWDQRVLEAVPARLRPAVRANVDARRAFRSMHHDLSRTLPAWRIVAPPPVEALVGHYRAAEREFGVGWEYLAAINLVETAMGRIRGTSVAGALGPMLVLPSTWARWGEGDINSPRDAIRAAARYLAANGFTRPGGIPGALWRYNNHSAYVRGVTRIASVMERDPRAFLGYYHWHVYYLTARGDVLLPEGYDEPRPVPVERYLSRR